MVDSLRDWWIDFVDDHPVLLKIAIGGVIAGAVILGIVVAPSNLVTDMIGLTSAKVRLRAFGPALMCSIREKFGSGAAAIPSEVLYGAYVRVDGSGHAVVDIPTGENWQRRVFVFADIEVLDATLLAAMLKRIGGTAVRVEVYPGGYSSLIFRDESDVALMSATESFVTFIETRPSKKANAVCARYYWSIAQGRDA